MREREERGRRRERKRQERERGGGEERKRRERNCVQALDLHFLTPALFHFSLSLSG